MVTCLRVRVPPCVQDLVRKEAPIQGQLISLVLPPFFFCRSSSTQNVFFCCCCGWFRSKLLSLFALHFIANSADAVLAAAPSLPLLSWPMPTSEPSTSPTASVAKLEQNGGGAARVQLRGGADNLKQGGALEVKI
jgi:hypothetical protein